MKGSEETVGSISAALSGPVCVPHFPKQRLVIEPKETVAKKKLLYIGKYRFFCPLNRT